MCPVFRKIMCAKFWVACTFLSICIIKQTSAAAMPLDVEPEQILLPMPDRICVTSNIEPQLQQTLERDTTGILRTSPLELSSQVSQAVDGSLSKNGISIYDARGAPIVLSTTSAQDEFCSPDKKSEIVVVNVIARLKTDNKPYSIEVTLRSNNAHASQIFQRDAVEDIQKWSAPSSRTIIGHSAPLQTGIGWSIPLDVQKVTFRLLARVKWRQP